MQTVFIVFIICYFLYKIMGSSTQVDKKELTDLVEKAMIGVALDSKEKLDRYEEVRKNNPDSYEEKRAYDELKTYIHSQEQQIKDNFTKLIKK